jgi:hypothetical protein
MREDSPAANITPAKLGDRAMQRTIAEKGRESQRQEVKIDHAGTAASLPERS